MAVRFFSHNIADICNLFLIMIFSILDLRLFVLQNKKNSMILFASLVFLGAGILLNLLWHLLFDDILKISIVLMILSFCFLFYFVFRKYNKMRRSLQFRRYRILQIVFLLAVVFLIFMMFIGIRMRYGLIYTALLMGCNVIFFIDHSEKQYIEKNEYNQSSDDLGERLSSHFVYNTLMSIEEICHEDGEKAAEVIEDFADYLKGNIQGLSGKGPIPFEQELQHVNTYIALQEKAMGRKMDIDLDLKVRDFRIPSLCLQPIVENAYKYSDRENRKISVFTFENNEDIVIRVENHCSDDIADLKDERKHLGIALKMIEEKLRTQVNGRFEFKREGDKVITSIRIPKKEAFQ